MKKTSVKLYRAIFFENFSSDVSCYLKPDEDMMNSEEIAGILHPTFSPDDGRLPDIVAKQGKYQPDSGGTSTFNRPNVLKRADGDFYIPDKTPITPDLKVKEDRFNKRLNAIHYTIMPSKPLAKEALKGQLDNFVRNAIKRQWEEARGL
jgi:hypothetical protein